ncbi:tRNA glutamyl-Q(34) synthetase GluQRS [Bermanella marisrubri]|uniref:Glutamyl-Q tRNA(Asp) synthetase n=1 Tax=Bermanella marisrubri TaxID=207949 RepID=Q1N0Z9_9GAMM|nr:tRNA glutamyl-Q(34) synthetase GluQRS [Bermanella marisrubri]EAT11875.1 glutamyl-Q tRNA(Asp) synthetase [Oceanobacter sp. RED65] [Bermanella marisrubri]QIZ83046.1 tRNA glutamyl-Q(34) synthetase GluQRS [Bermanella marisrubri]
MSYIGRFAPTPTGPLHFGSLVAALASYLDAKAHNGAWLLRIEDLDPPREDPNATKLIQQQLIAHDLHWDGQVSLQSQHHKRYEDVLAQLRESGDLFACNCSRKQLAEQQGKHLGRCHSNTEQPHAWRLAMKDDPIHFKDRVYGSYTETPLSEVGDQVLKRKDGYYAYQLAVVADDHDAGITHVVRGVDLLDNTARQIYLMQCLGYPIPNYMHIPLITNDQGQKLSKQNQAKALDLTQPQQNLRHALHFLQQAEPPTSLPTCSEVLAFAVENWQPKTIPANKQGLI